MSLTFRTQGEETELFLEVQPAEQLTIPDDELLALLEPLTTGDAGETGQVVHGAGRSHDQLARGHGLEAALTFGRVQPGTGGEKSIE